MGRMANEFPKGACREGWSHHGTFLKCWADVYAWEKKKLKIFSSSL